MWLNTNLLLVNSNSFVNKTLNVLATQHGVKAVLGLSVSKLKWVIQHESFQSLWGPFVNMCSFQGVKDRWFPSGHLYLWNSHLKHNLHCNMIELGHRDIEYVIFYIFYVYLMSSISLLYLTLVSRLPYGALSLSWLMCGLSNKCFCF